MDRTMSLIIKLTILSVLSTVVKTDFPLEFDVPDVEVERSDSETMFRLPEDLDPIHYDAEITPYFEATSNREAFTFDGLVTIYVRAMKSGINSLIVQENVREILHITVTDEANVPILLNLTNPFERLRQFHFLKINLRDGVTLENNRVYKLTIGYLGNINETPLSRGVFRGSYKGSDGRLHWYAATHLQPTNSRQVFPSFDEPGFKSTFNITIYRPIHFTESYSNMRIAESTVVGDRVKEVFHQTPRMSAYLVTFHISEEFTVIADNNDAARPYRILARPNARGQGEYALEVGPPLTRWFEEYFGIDYYTMGPDMKNDQIAVPDWASGATENWGFVSYRELRLLYEEGETNALDMESIATITAHELAHKWFGNLVTCRWWDNVWINEGFASYFEYFAMDGVDPSMELEAQFNVFYLQSALSADQSASTRALQHTVNTPAQVTGHFSGISYSKGASLLLMLKHFVTENTFRKALNYFLVDRSYEHAFPFHLYESFAKAVAEDSTVDRSINMTEFIRYWVEERGYPVLNVNVNMNTGLIELTQERFFISASAQTTDQAWHLPLTYTTGSNPDWNNLKASEVMTGKTHRIQKEARHEWVIFNLQQKEGFSIDYVLFISFSLRSYEHAYPFHLYESFAKAVAEDSTVDRSINMTEFIRYWVEERGYPVLNVNVNMNTGLIELTQERFFISASAQTTDQAWHLPLTYTTGSNPDWNNLKASEVMTGKTHRVQKEARHEWVIFNLQQKGIYRVNYDTHNWEMIASALKQNRESIHYLNRAQIVDDVFALMRSERITFNLGFQILEFLKNETNFFVWYPAISGFTWLRNRFLHLSDTLAEFDAILLGYLNAVVNELGYDVRPSDSHTTILNRFFILSFACNIGHEGCLNNAVEKFAALRTNGVSVNPNLRRHVFCEGLRDGGYEDWRFLYQRRLNSNNMGDQVAMLRALGCTTNERAIQEFLQMVLSDDVKAQDRVNALTFLYMGDRNNAKIALQFVKQRVDDIRRAVVLPAWFDNVLINLASYLDEEGLQDMETWLRANQATIPEFQTGLNAITSARTNMQWGTDRASAILRAARGSAAIAVPTIMLLLTTSIAMMLR
ncbi:Membrane alanyl aminopeptidase [Papilio machaon]|uniref:Membrane alanyl aminopeptidase n=1 Tax=Papilio machaon TaxID=76193 RepID=A0A194QKQ2_PAPMA|nr:Membrane alanyl aminopeptidase [Papilio machaon]